MAQIFENYGKFDLKTGEVIGYGAKPVKEPDFVKLYVMNMLEATEDLEIKGDSLVFINLCRYAVYADSDFPYAYLGGPFLEDVAKRCDLEVKSVRNAMSRLVKKGWLRKHESARGFYQINPYYVAKGEWKDIKELQFNWTKDGLSVNIIREE